MKEIASAPRPTTTTTIQLKHAQNFLKRRGQGQGLRLLPRPFDRLQGAGRNPAAPASPPTSKSSPKWEAMPRLDGKKMNMMLAPKTKSDARAGRGPAGIYAKTTTAKWIHPGRGLLFFVFMKRLPASGTSPTADLPHRLQGRGNPVAAPSVLFPDLRLRRRNGAFRVIGTFCRAVCDSGLEPFVFFLSPGCFKCPLG